MMDTEDFDFAITLGRANMSEGRSGRRNKQPQRPSYG